jgi:hypothetical protein
MSITPPPPVTNQVQVYTLGAIVAVMVIAGAVVGGVIITGHTDPASLALVASVIGSAGTIIAVLLNLLQTSTVSTKVQDVHLSLNSRLDQLVSSTASDAFQKGQAAGPTAAPPAPSAIPPPTGGTTSGTP